VHRSCLQSLARSCSISTCLVLWLVLPTAHAAPPRALAVETLPPLVDQRTSGDYPLGSGDVLKIMVFQHPDLSIESRIADSGRITFPLLGTLQVGGLSTDQAERLIARGLQEGGFLRDPQVSIQVSQFRSQQVSVLGNVNRPGRYPMDAQTMRLSEVLALAGGVSEGGGDRVVITTAQTGAPRRVNSVAGKADLMSIKTPPG